MLKFLNNIFEPIFLDKISSLKVLLNGISVAILTITLPLIFIPEITNLLSNGQKQEALYLSALGSTIFIFVFFVRNRFMYYWYWAMNIPFQTVIYKKYLPEVLKIHPLVFEKNGTGYHLTKFNSGVFALAGTAREFLYNIPQIILNLLLSLYLTFQFGILYGLIFGILFIIGSFLIVLFYRKEIELIYPSIEIQNSLSGDIARTIMSRQEILYANKGDSEVVNILKRQKEIFEIEKTAYKYTMKRFPYIWCAPYFILFITLFLESSNIINLSFAEITLLIILSNAITSSIDSMFAVVGNLFENYKHIIAFREMINEEKMEKCEEGDVFVHGGGEIELKDVDFKYDDKVVLNDFYLNIKPGEKIALVGHSGSGKTTIAKLISGYMNPTNGKVYIDGQNLADMSLKSYYKYLGYLTQEPMVFDGSIRENLLYAVNEKVDKKDLDNRIKEALQKANCDFVFQMKKGIETQIGEKGVRLSGGERQRLAIAKLFLKNPEIIILDEPTSALDSFSEEKISKALEELFKGRTTIIIAHRLQTVKKADRILVIEQGKIVEEGDHEKLISINGIYAQMLNMQSGF